MINYALIRVLFGVPLSDYQNVMFFRTSTVKQMEIEANSSFGAPEMLYKAYWMGVSFVEVPIRFIPRQAGTATGTKFSSLLASVRDIFKFWWLWRIRGKFQHHSRGTVKRLDPVEWDHVS
jgi:hypothetical protein